MMKIATFTEEVCIGMLNKPNPKPPPPFITSEAYFYSTCIPDCHVPISSENDDDDRSNHHLLEKEYFRPATFFKLTSQSPENTHPRGK